MSNQTFNMNPRNIKIMLGSYEVIGISAKDSAISMSGSQEFSDLAQGLNVTTITYAANVTMNISLSINAGSPSNTVLQAYANARYSANTGILPDEISLPASGIMNDIPFVISFISNSGIPSFIFPTKSYTIANMADLDIPYIASSTYDRAWDIKATFEPQDILGAAVTK